MILTSENRKTRIKTCPSATLSTTHPKRADPDGNILISYWGEGKEAKQKEDKEKNYITT
jgi:hypothetical protein